MPKKTKREKILAEIRRTSHHTASVSLVHEKHSINNSEHLPNDGLFRFQAQVAELSPTVKTEQTAELIAIRKGLLKTLILSLFAFAGELALYWRWELKP